MADLFIIREWLKFMLWAVAVAVGGGALATWHFWGQIDLLGDERSFLLAASITGALALAWVFLLVYFLAAQRVMQPSHHNPGALDAIPWWVLKVLLLVVFIGAMAYGLKRYGDQGENEFVLLRHGHLPQLEERLVAVPALLEKHESKGGPTLMQAAFRENHPEAVVLLLGHEASLDGVDPQGRSPVVASLQNLSMLEALLGAGLDPAAPDAEGNAPLHYAVALQVPEAARALVEAGADVDARDSLYRTPLLRAIESDDLEVAAVLLGLGANINAYDRRADTPLHKAVRRRNPESIMFLLEHGADPKLFNMARLSPLHIAAVNGQDELVEIFTAQPGLADLVDEDDRSAAEHAMKARQYETVRLLFRSGADINRLGKDGETLLHRMIRARDYNAASFLIDEGADVHLANSGGVSAYDLLRQKQLQRLLDLVDARDNPEAATNTVDTVSDEVPDSEN
ncbi:ankyrin repeat domain-containing protein [Pontiella sulfatireligans]|nr:ankyrin repeat domain-containing protein [Pontiella sulfatireligans]